VAVDELIGVVEQAIKDKSKIIVPAFSLGRTQELIYILHKLTDEKKIPRLPIYIDSPLAVTLTDIFSKHSQDFDHETWQDFGSRSEKPFAFRNLHYVRSVEESKSLNDMKGPIMIIAASGMAEGGRILHHLKNNISDPTVTVLVTGYQAESTLGRRIQDGNSPVRIYGEEYKIRARVLTLNEFSAHADQAGLLQYLSGIQPPKNIFLVHGEAGPAQTFCDILKKKYPGTNAVVPAPGQHAEI
jgi:metallo-beta-lactamase family protein